ncbi:MAG: MmcQ/YjbR family DNA-binding protein [Gemmatimonadaceae bacterium]
MPPSPTPLARVRSICGSFPGAHEVEAWESPTFRVMNKLFAMYAEPDNHHGAGHNAVWIKSTATNQSLLIGENPKRYFSPPYVGPSGWVGVRLDGRVNWTIVKVLLRDGYDLVVAKLPKKTRMTRITRITRRKEKG